MRRVGQAFPVSRIAMSTLVGALLAFAACGGNSSKTLWDDPDDGAPTGGTGVGGSAGTSSSGRGGTSTSGASSGGAMTTGGVAGAASGGKAGSTTVGGGAGTAATGGSAGTATTGGSSGSGAMGGAGGEGAVGGSSGAGGSGRECSTADDCVMFSDCCRCEAVPKGADQHFCDLVCITDACSALSIGRDEVTCSFGRCVIDRSCDAADATCSSNPEPCPNGQVRSVTENGCWGACLPGHECGEVTDCASCGEGDVCIENQDLNFTYGCVRPEPSCTKGNYCECLDPCPVSCAETEDSVACYCVFC